TLFARACAAGAFLLIAACAPVLAPQGVENETPAFTDTYLLARDGEHRPLRIWAADHPKAVIVALHGMGDYSNAFAMPGEYLAKQGITTLAYDQRGFGQSAHYGLWAGGDAMRRDLADALDAAGAKYPGIPVYALGESMGGAVVLSALAGPEPIKPSGVILVAPAVWSRDDMPASYRAALWLSAHVVPGMTVTGSGLKIWPSDNIPMLRAYSRDPFVQKETRADAVWGLVNLMDEARHAPDHLSAPPPILFLYGKQDQVIPAPPTEAVIAALDGKAEVHRYDHGYHMLLRDLDRQTVWQDVVTWIGNGGKR
ncbi:MAG TPA: alpha/beta hydrolase, partial [Rhizomicrobium sp.]|nr:alpha/beta hydrolase [Rhizomicrobium sp.]